MLSAAAAALVIGAHLHTFHTNHDMRDSTPGIYAVAPGVGVLGGSLTGGIYRNSIGRTSVYLGQSWQAGRYGLTLGAVSGYQITTKRGQAACRPGYISVPGNECTRDSAGLTRAVLAPLVVPSIAWTEAKTYIGATPRASFLLGKHGPALHLSVEWIVR